MDETQRPPSEPVESEESVESATRGHAEPKVTRGRGPGRPHPGPHRRRRRRAGRRSTSPRPSGRSCAAGCTSAPPPLRGSAGWLLILLARGTSELAAVAVYAVATTLLFTVSATYHRGRWSPRTHGWLKRFDHANIFLLIAGTYTPFTVILLQGGRREALLWIIWSAAPWASRSGCSGWAPRAGCTSRPTSPWLDGACSSCPTSPRSVAWRCSCCSSSAAPSTRSGAWSTRAQTRPVPRWFGFHEVFHAFTLAAYIAQYVAVLIVVVTR